MTVIYADVYLIINFAADYIILMASSRVIGRKNSCLRTVIASVTGSVYALVSSYLCIDGVLSVLSNITVSVVMCLVCTGKCRGKTLFGFVSTFYILSMFLGGALTAISNVLLSVSLYINKSVPLPVLLLVSAFLCFVFMTVSKRFSSKLCMTKVQAEFCVLGRTGSLSLLCDTGNVAIDPYSTKYVIVVRRNSLSRILGEDFSIIENSFTNGCEISRVRPRLIPIRTAAGEGIMTAFSPDSMFVISKTSKTEIDACIAIDECDDNTYCGTDGAVPYALVSDMF